MTSAPVTPAQDPAESVADGRSSDDGSSARRNLLARRWAVVRETAEAGMSTAEYAVGTVAACAFAAVLYRVVTGGSIVTGLTNLVDSALATLS